MNKGISLDFSNAKNLMRFFVYRVTELLNYLPEELIGRNFYSLIHGQDVTLMKKCHLDCKYSICEESLFYYIQNYSL